MWWVDFLVFLVLSLVLSVSKKEKKRVWRYDWESGCWMWFPINFKVKKELGEGEMTAAST